MQFQDIVSRVQFKCDDIDGTYITSEYCQAGAQDVYEWLYNKLRLVDSSFDTVVVVLPAVPAGTPDLTSYQAAGNPLATLVQPRMIRWRIPGQPDTQWRKADGPLDFQRDMPDGIPQLDSWAWIRYVVKLSKFSTALDLEISGEFLFDPLTSTDNQIEIANNSNRTFACKLASEIGKARGNQKWETTYGADADEALEDLEIAMVKANQAKTNRLGRMSRSGSTKRLSVGR